MKLRIEVGLGPDHIVRWGTSPPPKKGAQQPTQFSTHVCCGQSAGWTKGRPEVGQMAGWIKMLFGTETGYGPGHTVLHGNPAP